MTNKLSSQSWREKNLMPTVDVVSGRLPKRFWNHFAQKLRRLTFGFFAFRSRDHESTLSAIFLGLSLPAFAFWLSPLLVAVGFLLTALIVMSIFHALRATKEQFLDHEVPHLFTVARQNLNSIRLTLNDELLKKDSKSQKAGLAALKLYNSLVVSYLAWAGQNPPSESKELAKLLWHAGYLLNVDRDAFFALSRGEEVRASPNLPFDRVKIEPFLRELKPWAEQVFMLMEINKTLLLTLEDKHAENLMLMEQARLSDRALQAEAFSQISLQAQDLIEDAKLQVETLKDISLARKSAHLELDQHLQKIYRPSKEIQG